MLSGLLAGGAGRGRATAGVARAQGKAKPHLPMLRLPRLLRPAWHAVRASKCRCRACLPLSPSSADPEAAEEGGADQQEAA